jgi:hypothetical protein
MCFSFEVSVATFVISWSISFYLLRKNLTKYQRQNIIFLMIFSSIQLADAILWYHKMKKNNINYLVTSYLIPLLLSLQLMYRVFFVNNSEYIKFIDDKLLKIFIFIGICYLFYRFNGYSKSLCDNKLSSPIWGSNEIKIWELIIFAFLIFYPDYFTFTTMIILLLLIKLIVGGAYGTLWCAITTLIAFYYLYKY